MGTPSTTETFLQRQARREAERRDRTPAWIRRALGGELYGRDAKGQPVVKDTAEAVRP